MPVQVSTVALLCKSCDQPTRVGMKLNKNGDKVRFCRKCGSEL
jgi:large subunit ribosomal protein L24